MFDHPEPGIAAEPADVIDTGADTPRGKAQRASEASALPEADDTAFLLRHAQVAELKIRDLEEALHAERTARAADLADAQKRTSDLETHLRIAKQDRDEMSRAFHEARLKAPGRIDPGFAEWLLARTLWLAIPWSVLVGSTVVIANIYLI